MSKMADSDGVIGLQRPSHEDLIEMVSSIGRPTSTDARLDAIIVPASRPYKNLATAIELARAKDCHLVVLCSMDTRPEKVRSLFTGKNFAKGTAVEVPKSYSIPHLELATTEWVKRGPGKAVSGGRDSDLSVKRNVGLLIARMLGWQRIFFMDDDIRGLTEEDLDRTVSVLGIEGIGYSSSGLHVEHFQSSSMRVKHFPDNSVVCHARRMVAEHQDVFVSGSVLAVDCAAQFDFFPDIYNEDWLFFYRDVAARRLASPGLHATKIEQVKYNPFADPRRAAKEEFGDVIAEGLYSLLHHKLGMEFATVEYWNQFIDSRNGVLDDVCRKLHEAPVEFRDEIEKAMRTARETLDQIEARMCVDYLGAWRRDLFQWEITLGKLPKEESVPDALRELRLLP